MEVDMELHLISRHQIHKELRTLNNRLDRITRNYNKARVTLDRINKLEHELELRNNISK